MAPDAVAAGLSSRPKLSYATNALEAGPSTEGSQQQLSELNRRFGGNVTREVIAAVHNSPQGGSVEAASAALEQMGFVAHPGSSLGFDTDSASQASMS